MSILVRRAVAVVALSLWIAGLVLPVAGAHARVFDDVACGAGVVSSAHPVPQFEARRAPVDDGHCAVCHLQRAIGGAIALAENAFAAQDLSRGPAASFQRQPRFTAALSLSSRAPPCTTQS